MATDDLATVATPPEPAVRASRVRYGVLAFLCALSFVLYLDRLCISKAAPQMEHDLGLSHTLMGIVFSAFTVPYVLFQVYTGHLGDRYGSRGMLVRIVLWWSLFTALTGCVWYFQVDYGTIRVPWLALQVPLLFNSFLLLVLVRFLFGVGESGALPNSARVVARWFPAAERGSAQGLVNTAMLVGGFVAPILAAYLIGGVGWRGAFLAFAVLGLIWAALFARWFHDDPAEHPGVNLAERQLLAPAATGGSAESQPRLPWRWVLTSPNVWLLGAIMTCMCSASYFYFFWYPTYLENGRGIDPIRSGWLSGLVLVGGAIGSTCGGYLSDWLQRWTGERSWSRRLIGCGGLSFAALGLAGSLRCESATQAALLTALAFLAASATLAAWWAVVTDISGTHVGALFGLMNSLGGPGAVGSQYFFGWFADWRGRQGFTGRAQWDAGFYVMAGMLALGALCWLLIDATKSAVGPRSAGTEK